MTQEGFIRQWWRRRLIVFLVIWAFLIMRTHTFSFRSGFSQSSVWRSGALTLIILLTLALGIGVLGRVWRLPYDGVKWDSSGTVFYVAPDGPAANSGIQMGDQLSTLDGVPLAEQQPLYGSKGPGETVRVSFLRGTKRLNTTLVLAAPHTPWNNDLSLVLLGVTFWLLGVGAYLPVAHKAQAQSLLLLCLAGAAILWSLPFASLQVEWARWVIGWSVALAGATLFQFHVLFPHKRAGKWWQWAIRLDYLLALALMVLYSLLRLPTREWFVDYGITRDGVGGLIMAYFLLNLLAGLTLLMAAYRTDDGYVRRRVRLIVVCSLLGFTPLIGYILGNIFLGSLVPLELATLSLVVVPTAYSLSLRNSDLITLDMRLYRWLNRLLVSVAIVVAYLGTLRVAAQFNPAAAQLPLTGALVSLLIAALFVPLQRVTERSLYRIFYGPSYDYLEVLTKSLHSLVGSTDERQLVEVLTRDLPRAIEVDQAGLWVREVDQTFRFAGGRLHPVVEENNLKLSEPLQRRLKAGEPFHHFSTTESQPLFPALNVPASWWLPLVYEGILEGIWIVGPRHHDQNFSPHEYRLMTSTATQAALVLKVMGLVAGLKAELTRSETLRKTLVRTRDDERSRVARDLHDQVFQWFQGMQMAIGFMREQSHPNQELWLGQIETNLQKAISHARRICHGLRPVELDDGLYVALTRLADQVVLPSEVAIVVGMNLPQARLGDEVERTIYSIVQEALNNTVKHARATQAEVQLDVLQDSILLFVQDNGVGFNSEQTSPGRLGLRGIQERIKALHGELTIESSPDEGTALWVYLPRQPGAQPFNVTPERISTSFN